MRLAYKPRCMDNGACRKSFDYWKALQQKRNPAFEAPPYRLGEIPDTDSIWSLREVYVLYRDRELVVDMDDWGYDDSIHRHGWYEQEREALHVRLQERASLITLFVIQLGFALNVYEDDEVDSAFHRRLGFEWAQRKDVYNATAPFFGRAFRPVMEAFKLHLRGERESVLYPFGTGIEAAEVNRLVAEHLGVLRYNCLGGKSNRQGQRCEVTLGAYSEGERLQVASYLMAQQRPPIPVRLLLCELALRKVIPQGTYDIQV